MYHLISETEVIREFKSDPLKGLSTGEAEKRLAASGPNSLPVAPAIPVWKKFISQFQNLLVIILLVATLVSFVLGETVDAIAIAAIVIINAVIGFVQEVKAEKTLDSLKSKEIHYTLVVRNSETAEIEVKNMVTGDIVILEEGSKIPADCRIIESFSLRVDESILTGESQAAEKNHQTLDAKSSSLADRTNMLYKDTKVMAGRGKAIVVATGRNTEIGKIAAFLEEKDTDKTPLTIELEKVGRVLSIAVGGIAGLIFAINILARIPLIDSLLVSISLSVAAIPEGLPAIVTIVLSIGVKRLADKKTIVKKLLAVETLGAIKIIATDKTGTITQNKINVVRLFLPDGKEYSVTGQGYRTTGQFYDETHKMVNPQSMPSLTSLLTIGVLANNAALKISDTEETQILGDTTEGSLLVTAKRAGMNLENIKEASPRLYEVPFSAERKMMSVIVDVDQTSDHMLYAKGAPEVILSFCKIAPDLKKKILLQTELMAKEGLRSLAFAGKKITRTEVGRALEKNEVNESDLEFMGITGMHDPLRPEVKEALIKAKFAGIRTIMVTGDHKETARCIAIEAGIMVEGDKVVTDEMVDKMTLRELTREIKNGASVFARISPMGKLKIIKAIKAMPFTQVAVTGDGVNDAPALKEGHIGVAMGKTGTDLTREVADIVITDDNYATIIDAIREGRVIFANLVKFIRYLISCNLSEVFIVALGVIFSTPFPLIPIQLLWINLITDGLPALALGLDPAELDIMKRPPRNLTSGILHKKRWAYMTLEGAIMGMSVFLLFIFMLERSSYVIAQTMAFTALSLSQLVHSLNNRSTRTSLFKLGIFSNHFLIGAIIISVGLQFMAVTTEFGNRIFKTTALNWNLWGVIIIVSLLPLLVSETKKLLLHRHHL